MGNPYGGISATLCSTSTRLRSQRFRPIRAGVSSARRHYAAQLPGRSRIHRTSTSPPSRTSGSRNASPPSSARSSSTSLNTRITCSRTTTSPTATSATSPTLAFSSERADPVRSAGFVLDNPAREQDISPVPAPPSNSHAKPTYDSPPRACVSFVVAFASCPSPALRRKLQSLRPGPAAPAVSKVEPPNWWTDYVFSGDGAAVRRKSQRSRASRRTIPAYHIDKVQTEPDGKHAFVWLNIDVNAKPGTVAIRVKNSGGETTANLLLSARPPQQGKYQGVTPDDVIYLIMPDRFADGDPVKRPAAAGRTGHLRSQSSRRPITAEISRECSSTCRI